MAKELKAKGYNVIPGHFLCCQCVKNYDNIMEGDQNESDIEQNESDNDYSCETPRKKVPAFTLWVSPLSIYMVLLNTVRLELQKTNWTEHLKY